MADNRVATFFQRFGLALFSFVAVFVFGECTVRTVDTIAVGSSFFGADKTTELYDEHPFLYRVPKPGAEYVTYHVNSLGFRGPDFAAKKPPGTYRVFVLGGSAVWDPNVSSGDKTWVATLERLLNAHLKREGKQLKAQVINAGVPGYNSSESFMNLVWRVLPLEPDAFVVYHGYNDFKPNRTPGFKSDYSHYRKLDHGTYQTLQRSFRLLYHLRKLTTFVRTKPEAFDTVATPGVRAFQANLRHMALVAREHGVDPIFATYAMSVSEENRAKYPGKFDSLAHFLPQLTFDGVLDAHRRYNQAVVELGAEIDAPVVDAASHVPKDFEHFTDHCHLSDTGAAELAQAVEPVVYAVIEKGKR